MAAAALGVAAPGLAATLACTRPPSLGRWLPQAQALAPILLGIVHVDLGWLAARAQPLRRATVAVAGPLGRTALSCDLAQSALMGAPFYGYGLGWFGRARVTRAVVVCVVTYAVQAAYARLYLGRFRFGPLTCAAVQPMAARVSAPDRRGRSPGS